MITINDLSFKYGKKEVLNDISMKLEAGKIYGLLGENGVGKTTLLKIISGLQKPWKGSCSVFGEDPFKRTPSFLSRIFYLPEELEFIQHDYSISYFAKINAPFYPKFDKEKFESILKEFEVEGDKKLNKLSYGQMKKAVLSFAIATNAELLLLDELGYLPIDKRGADLMFQVVAARYECGSIVLTTNRIFREWGKIFDVDNTLATAMIDRLMHHGEAILIDGKSYRTGEGDEPVTSPPSP